METQEAGDTDCFSGGEAGGWGWRGGGREYSLPSHLSFNFRTIWVDHLWKIPVRFKISMRHMRARRRGHGIHKVLNK